MGRGFESHRGHGIERQVVNKKAIWLFSLCQPLAFLPKSERIALQLFILVDCLNSLLLSINEKLWKAQIFVLYLRYLVQKAKFV